MGCAFGPAVGGYFLGVATAMVLDYTLLSSRRVRAAVVPNVTKGAGTLSLVGRF